MHTRCKLRTLAGRWPGHGWLGLGLVAVFWIVNWAGHGARTHWAFFPLWLGYCLTVDALVFVRKGDSMWKRNRRAYVALFLVSAPAWWLFELFNLRTRNWFYVGRQLFDSWEYALLASLSFSTVMPAVFGTAELIGTWERVARLQPRWRLEPTRPRMAALFAVGWLMLALLLIWPRVFFPFLWLSVFCILEPLNVKLGNRSLAKCVAAGDWRPIVALCSGALICGFFWEMWNFYSYPKWIYSVPFVGVLHVFEMPLAGYLGYLPFALELFALYHLVIGTLGNRGSPEFIQLTTPAAPRGPDSIGNP